MEKNAEVTVRIDKLGINGEGVGTLDDGMKIFVPFTLSGETVRALVVAVKKSFCFGRLQEVVTPSPDRAAPLCPVFGKCGGCQLQHCVYSAQTDFKRTLVVETLQKVGGMDVSVNPTVFSPTVYGYRNKIQIPVGLNRAGKTVIGFYRSNSHDIVETEQCPLHGEWAAKLIRAAREYIASARIRGWDETTGRGELRHLVARRIGNRMLVCAVTASKNLPSWEVFRDLLRAEFEDVSLLQNINARDTNVILGNKTVVLDGVNALETEIGGVRARIAIESFLQVNTEVASALYDAAADAAVKTSEDVIVDAYSGAGILSAILARRCKAVFGLEICAEAVTDADRLARENGIENLINRCGDCAELVPPLVRGLLAGTEGGLGAVMPDRLAVVLDPPRKGCDARVLDAVKSAAPARIVYISCNPATLSRDLGSLATDYDVQSVTPYDMFPQTAHVETLVVLCKKSVNHVDR